MLNNTNKYKFDFGNTVKSIVSYIIEIFENLGIIFLTWIAVFLIGNLISEIFPDCFAKELILKFFTNHENFIAEVNKRLETQGDNPIASID